MKRWRFTQRWAGGAALPSEMLTALTMRQELEAIADRRQWEPAEVRRQVVTADRRAVDSGPSDRAA